jgi:alpha-beta hydrolase superfamily lysophospholipase
MEHREGKFRGYNNLNLYYQYWLPLGGPKAILLVVNGLAEHSGRYANLVKRFVPKGYAIYSYDHRGHGKSEGVRCYVDRFSNYLDDLKTFVDKVRHEHRDAKIFVIGHSMGGTITIAHAIHHQHELDGLLLSGASLKTGPTISPALIAMAGILSLLLPKIGTTILDASAISRDKAVVDAYVSDPLVYRGKIRARLGAELIKTMHELPAKMPEINLPILIMHGAADQLSDPKGSQMLFERAGSKDKTLKLYDGFYHEIFNEPKRERVFKDVEAWLTTHI